MDPQQALHVIDDLRRRIDAASVTSSAPLAHSEPGLALVDRGAASALLPALDVALAALAVAAAREEARARRPAQLGRRWTADDDAALVEAFGSGAPVENLAERFARSVGAIEARLERLGLLAPDQRRTRSRYPVHREGVQLDGEAPRG